MITITETLYKKMPDDIKACFNQLPNPSSEEVRECFPEAGGGKFTKTKRKRFDGWREMEGRDDRPAQTEKIDNYGDSGNASRFFKSIIYQAKASKSERNKGCEGLDDRLGGSLEGGNDKRNGDKPQLKPTKNNHPTVKPVALMEYLIKMVTPPIVFVCEKCYNGGYEKQKTNSDSTQLSNMRDTVQAKRQPAQGEVLLQEVCLSGGENDNRKTLPILQDNVSAEENGQKSPDLLQSELCGKTHGDVEEVKSVIENKEGVSGNLQTRASDVKQAGNGITTPNNNGGTLGETPTSNRDSSSQKPQERRQQGGELGDNDTKATQCNSEIKEKNNLSSLSGNRRCPKCGEGMVKRAGVVLDPFAGSGSTLVAAKQNGFNYIGIEMTEEYIPIIEARLKEVQSSLF